MDLRDKIRKELRETYGEFDTFLEHEYEEKIVEKLYVENIDRRLPTDEAAIKRAWATYNQVIVEFKHNLKDMLKVKELQYRLTEDKESPRMVCIEVLEGSKSRSEELRRLYNKIMNFIDGE